MWVDVAKPGGTVVMLNARNGRLKLKTGEMDYIRFGTGEKTLVMIPGVGDGLKTVKGMALPFAFLYRSLVKDFTVYVFSRRVHLSPEMSTREMAEDLNLAMEALGLSKPIPKPVAKKRGRPRKNPVEETSTQAPKRRGRPKKNQ